MATYTTELPQEITVPDEMQTRIGTLRFFDGAPDDATVQAAYDNLDFQRAMSVFLNCQAGPALAANLRGARSIGIGGRTTAGIFLSKVDSRALNLTPNTQTVTLTTNFDLTETGPMVLEVPPGVLGIVDDAWMRFVTDMGVLGEDHGRGGKYLLLPPGYDGEVPDGYYVRRPITKKVWVGVRGFTVHGDTQPAVDAFVAHYRQYPLDQAENPPITTLIDMSGKYHNNIQPTDATFFDELNDVIQDEPTDGIDPETLGMIASIGIEKGKPFAPDDRMKAILTDAAAVGSATARAIAYRPRNDDFYYRRQHSRWTQLFVGGSYEFLRDGARYMDARTAFFYTAAGVTPAMAAPAEVGKGSQYAVITADADGAYFDGAQTYRLHLDAGIPAANFWSTIVYDTQTRSLLQTDQPGAGISSEDAGVTTNPDGHDGRVLRADRTR